MMILIGVTVFAGIIGAIFGGKGGAIGAMAVIGVIMFGAANMVGII